MIYRILYCCFDFQTQIQEWIRKSPTILAGFAFLKKIKDQITKVIYNIPDEPEHAQWYSTVSIFRNFYRKPVALRPLWRGMDLIVSCFAPVDKWKYVEYYTPFNETYYFAENELFKIKQNSRPLLDNAYSLFIYKTDDWYYTNIIGRERGEIALPYFGSNEKHFQVKFMAIEYKHPSLKTPLPIDLSPFRFAEGSEILSSVFIYWYLRKMYGSWVNRIFDLDYKLSIIDGDFKMLELDAFNFIGLRKGDYSIHRLFSLTQ